MDISEYQQRAGETDILTGDDDIMPLLGLAGEVGQLIAEYKKRQRDKVGYRAFRDEVHEELGDILWYAAALARYNGFDLDEIARKNLDKTRGLFLAPEQLPAHALFDQEAPADQRLPTRLTVTWLKAKRAPGAEKPSRESACTEATNRSATPSTTTASTATTTATTTSSTSRTWQCSAGLP